MKHQALFSLKDKSEKLKCRLLQSLFSALRVEKFVTTVFSRCHKSNRRCRGTGILKPSCCLDTSAKNNIVNPLYNGIRYNSKIRYIVSLVCKKNQQIVCPLLFLRKTYVLDIC